MKIPAKTHGTFTLSTDYSKKFVFNIYTLYEYGNEKSTTTFIINPLFTYQPINTLKFSMSVNYRVDQFELQYVDCMKKNENIFYFLGKLDMKTLNATFRVDYNINPELSLQYYGSPFITTRSYSNFKLVNNPLDETYKNRFQILDPVLTSNNEYVTSEGFTFPNLDHMYAQFRSNLVFRWEYLPGSKLYFVWSNESTLYQSVSNPELKDAFSGFEKPISNNIFLVKLNYWFSL
jgi:hypothetical protein